jgi:lysyl-tRNA synthetase class 2
MEALPARDALMRCIRACFHAKGFLEVETPVRMETPCMELHIDAEPSGDQFLRTSPELFHKKLLAQGAEKIFEVAKCFRQGERGALHHPEYTMLEWYRTGGDYETMRRDVESLLKAVEQIAPARVSFPKVQVLSVAEAFLAAAGWNPVETFDPDRFDIDLVEKVEPSLAPLGAVILKDYPAALSALARLKPGHPTVAERWELYLNGIEVANAYSELTDPVEQRARFEACAEQRRAMGKVVYPIDEVFIQSLENMPPSGGCALGLDRLLMILLGETSLDSVLPFGRE